MKREAILRLSEPVWIEDIVPDDPLAVAIIPAMSSAMEPLLFDPTSETARRRACERFLVDFKGYEGDSGPIANTLEARLELFGYAPVRTAIGAKMHAINEATEKGEDFAASE